LSESRAQSELVPFSVYTFPFYSFSSAAHPAVRGRQCRNDTARTGAPVQIAAPTASALLLTIRGNRARARTHGRNALGPASHRRARRAKLGSSSPRPAARPGLDPLRVRGDPSRDRVRGDPRRSRLPEPGRPGHPTPPDRGPCGTGPVGLVDEKEDQVSLTLLRPPW